MIASKLTSLKQYRTRLLSELKDSSRQVITLIEKLEQLPPDSEAYGDAEGELYARALQLELDASDLRKVTDEITVALPEGEN